MPTDSSLLIVLAAGLSDGGKKAAVAFGVALSALSSGSRVHLFLTLDSAVLGTPSGAAGIHPRGFSGPLSEYITHFLELGGLLEVCSSCFEEYCRDLPRGDDGRTLLQPGTTIHGLGVIAERAGSMPVLTF
jgi:predicted peroxiredoxin